MGWRMAKDKQRSPVAERPRGGPARRVAELVPGVGQAAFRRFGFIQSSIVSRWTEIAGAKYADVSVPESIRFPQGKKSDGTLTLLVERAFGPMMQHVEPVIIERVNRFFGYAAVARITLKQGSLMRNAARPKRPELRPVPAELGDSLREIADPELRAVLSSLAQGVANSPPVGIPVLGKVK
ncbi:DUF721 domain-containing protein [Chakrabartia godavariana]|nr:DUF721 domain-containing protein [Chakrabartia godavariana]